MGLFRFYFGVFAAAVLFVAAACSSAALLPHDAYRLTENEIKIEGKARGIKTKELQPYLKQTANKTIFLGIRFHLGMYAAAPPCDSCWLGKAMRTLGEAPVIFDPDMVGQSKNNLTQYMRSRGYYGVQISDSVVFKRHKAKVIYTVTPNEVTRIRTLRYDLGDDSLSRAILADSVNSLLRPGNPLSTDIMDKERERLELLLHNKAFYAFGKNQLTFLADTIGQRTQADLTMTRAAFPGSDTLSQRRYKIRDIKIYSDFDQTVAYTDSSYYTTMQRVALQAVSEQGELALYYHEQPVLRHGMYMEALRLRPGDAYNETLVNRTYNNFTSLNVFRVVNIQFVEVMNEEGEALVDCHIRLTPAKSQGFKTNFEFSVSSNALFGVSPIVSYFHKNLFNGAEYLNLSFLGDFQFRVGDTKQRATEVSASPSLSVPKFLFPWLYRYMSPYMPRTEFLSSYSFQYRPDYTRNSIVLSFGYTWHPSSRMTYNITPVNLNIVNVYNLSRLFYESLTDPFLRNRYENHFVFGLSASLIYTDRLPNKRLNSVYLRWNVETAGNTISLLDRVLSENGGTRIFGNTYAQFAKTDLNISYYQYLNDYVMLAYRAFGGVGRGYGNSIAMPFEEVYFSGGAYSLRGWQARALGPGAAPMDSTFSIPNQVGDMKLEGNIEFRYKIFRALEGALFLEGGNIWSLNPADSRAGAYFRWSDFYRQMALNTGLGLRLNFGFLVIRLDWGMRMHDPAPGKGWISMSNWLKSDNSSFHFGIGYPF
ncbi:MAG: BamA/TamA family outer membrane protein [Prevotellaceae bacterium]|jgi:outer membrane protein assembly factor BamA|nr:BamA/TamA family outer membrane protein [Prevotellaceae bacterium]